MYFVKRLLFANSAMVLVLERELHDPGRKSVDQKKNIIISGKSIVGCSS